MAFFIVHCVQCATFIVKDGNKYYVLCCLLYNVYLVASSPTCFHYRPHPSIFTNDSLDILWCFCWMSKSWFRVVGDNVAWNALEIVSSLIINRTSTTLEFMALLGGLFKHALNLNFKFWMITCIQVAFFLLWIKYRIIWWYWITIN
jgi:hypothetical protein